MRLVDQDHTGIGFGDEGVGERHPHGTGTYHEVVGVQFLDSHLVCTLIGLLLRHDSASPRGRGAPQPHAATG
ncbi:hypothetical protein Mkiyose1665_48720 [Mycobacterium kiyosense]|nr:hypothetical protein SRL2020400_37180 [Mycobacterium kiyosense]GLC15381.1 hypothetical protein SRL2020448_39840 [Mycobacterium kiyosense]GLD34366.1 hypothetical protein Mkiyose1595_05860 [Mycobacterium kiyosense]GLD44372.1 hypothetical protein Mkiyose1665_48720 [Mycobacterium kiyosense]